MGPCSTTICFLPLILIVLSWRFFGRVADMERMSGVLSYKNSGQKMLPSTPSQGIVYASSMKMDDMIFSWDRSFSTWVNLDLSSMIAAGKKERPRTVQLFVFFIARRHSQNIIKSLSPFLSTWYALIRFFKFQHFSTQSLPIPIRGTKTIVTHFSMATTVRGQLI